MTQTIERRRVIRITATWAYNKVQKTKYFYERARDHDSKGDLLHSHSFWAGVDDSRDATDLATVPLAKAMTLFYAIKDRLQPNEKIELVDLELIMNLETVQFDEDEKREFLRKKALDKLSEDEVRALGVESLAIYDKLKNHEA